MSEDATQHAKDAVQAIRAAVTFLNNAECLLAGPYPEKCLICGGDEEHTGSCELHNALEEVRRSYNAIDNLH